eukprot:snap_masked-scaffold_5-processed-gene-8.34-mRNA-1 protein AED:0.46 eAED:0.46 QI:0/-1/0/1/-1/1/1/0/784
MTTTDRAPNMKQIMKMFEEILLKQEEYSQKKIKAIVQSLAGMNANIDTLESFSLKKMQKFVRQYEKQSKDTRKYINLKDKLETDVYSQLEYLGKTNSNEEIIEALKKKILEIKLRDVGSAEALLKQEVTFRNGIDEEEAVEILFREVDETLESLPEEAEKKPKKIAETIFDLLPSYIWVKKDDLNMKPRLKEANRLALKKYVLKNIPPRHVRKELNEFYAWKKAGKPGLGATKRPKYAVKSAAPAKRPDVPDVDELLCDHDWIYGHTRKFCYALKAKKPAETFPGRGEMERRLAAYRAKRNKSHVIPARKIDMKAEKSSLERKAEECFGANQLLALDECPKGFFSEKEKKKVRNASVVKFGSVLEKLDGEDGKVSQVTTGRNNSVIQVEFSGITLTGLLDSGAFRSVMNGKQKSRCDKLKTLDKPIRVQAAGGVIYPVHEVGFVMEMSLKSNNPGLNTFKLKDVELMILEVPEWDDIILGNDILSRYGLDPLSALERRMGEGKSDEPRTNLAQWFVEVVGKESVKVKSIGLQEGYPYNKNGIPPEVFGWDWPEEDEFLGIENIDVGVGADILDKKKDDQRMKELVFKKAEELPLDSFGGSVIWKKKFQGLFAGNPEAFGDSKSYTQLSDIHPIRCDIFEGTYVGVQKQLPLGQEQEDFLFKRIEHMLRAGIIEVNKNPTTAMSVLVVPKKGPKRFRLVVDFRPLNRVTKKVTNTLPKIEVQLDRVKGNNFFAGFDLLSGFDYLACEKQAGEYFTFTTPWGVSYSFLGAPQGWCNTPSFIFYEAN